MVEEELEAQGNQLDRPGVMSLMASGGRDTEKGKNPREISKQGDLAISDREERETLVNCQDLGL